MQIRHIIFSILVVGVLGYFFYEAWGVLFYPKLKILKPQNNAILNVVTTNISGESEPKTIVWVNGREFITDEKGFFQGEISLDPGYNQLGIKVKNRFGKETRKVLRLVVK